MFRKDAQFKKSNIKPFKSTSRIAFFRDRVKILILIILFILILVFFFLLLPIFKVKTINITTNNASCVDQAQVKQIINSQNQFIFFIKTQPLVDQLEQKFICLEGGQISKNLPNSLHVNLSGREAKLIINSFQIATDSADLAENIESTSSAHTSIIKLVSKDIQANENKKFLVDSTGFVFSSQTDQVLLPEIKIINQMIKLGDSLNTEIKNSLSIIEKINQLNLPISEMTILNKDILVIDVSNQRLIFALDKDLNKQLGSLQLIFQKATIDSKLIEFLDLRFDKPVVRYSPKK